MTHPPTDASFTVLPDEVDGLADELRVLATELAEDADDVRSAAAVLPVALAGAEGWTAGSAATAWATLFELVAGRTRALSTTLAAAAAAYRAEDAALSGRLPR